MMGGYAAETVLLGEVAPVSIESDCNAANQFAKIICRSSASRSAFLEHTYQEAVALIKEHKHVVLALAEALIDHPEHTLDAKEIDAVIAAAVARDTPADRAGEPLARCRRARRQPHEIETLIINIQLGELSKCRNQIAKGDSIDVAAPSGGVVSGQAYQIGSA